MARRKWGLFAVAMTWRKYRETDIRIDKLMMINFSTLRTVPTLVLVTFVREFLYTAYSVGSEHHKDGIRAASEHICNFVFWSKVVF